MPSINQQTDGHTGSRIDPEGFSAEFSNYQNGEQKYLKINLSDLKLKLRDFKEAVLLADVKNPLIGVVGLWVPFFTSEFRNFIGVDPNAFKIVYLCATFVLSWILIKNIFYRMKYLIVGGKKDMKLESDPDVLADCLYKNDNEN